MLSPRRRFSRGPWRIIGAIGILALLLGLCRVGLPLLYPDDPQPTPTRQLSAEQAAAQQGEPAARKGDLTSGRKGRPGSIQQADVQQGLGAAKGNTSLASAPVKGEGSVNGTTTNSTMTGNATVMVDAAQALTRELIESVAQDGYVMVSMVNEHYLDFTESWLANVKRAGIEVYLIGATDRGMYDAMTKRGVPTWLVDIEISEKDLGWGSKQFMKLSRWKIHVLQLFAELAPTVSVILSDVDTAWMRNPIPFFKRFPEADILSATDMLSTVVMAEELEYWPDANVHGLNVGIMVIRPTNATKKFLAEWDVLAAVPNAWDQTVFSKMLERNPEKESCGKGLWRVMNGTMTVGALNPVQFGGHMFFVQSKSDEIRLNPYVVHTIFQYGGTPGKRNRLREAMLFEDPPSYYDHPKGFINVRIDIPQRLFDAANGQSIQGALTEDKLKAHFELVNYQLVWIRAGIALAQLTGRVLIMPRIFAELDRYWGLLLNGNIPGVTSMRKSFVCPMDHIMEMERWFQIKPVEAFGPHVEWREYSFLQNPRLPREIYNSRLALEICDQPGPGCSNGWFAQPNKNGLLRLNPGMDSDQLLAALEQSSEYKILDVTNIVKMWPPFREESGWFTDPRQHQSFVRRIKDMTAAACCTQENPAWVHYDMLWDVPHTDRHGRRFDTWRLMRGDHGPPPSPTLSRQLPIQALPAATKQANPKTSGVA